MNVGEKLKELRKRRGMTQSELAGGVLTRNMLSQIERGAALPSYTTLSYLAERLNVDPGYFFENGRELGDYELYSSLPAIRKEYDGGCYGACLEKCAPYLDGDDREIRMIASDCCFHLAIERYDAGDFPSSLDLFDRCASLLPERYYNAHYAEKIEFYKTMIDAFDGDRMSIPTRIFSSSSNRDPFTDLLIYSFLDSLIDSSQSERAALIYNAVGIANDAYRTHFNARIAASLHNYDRAKELLMTIVTADQVSRPFLFRVYDDLERYCKASDDYEGAYKCLVSKQKYAPVKS